MAKKIAGYIKLQIPAGKATPAPPVGPALGQHGVNIMEFVKQFNERTAQMCIRDRPGSHRTGAEFGGNADRSGVHWKLHKLLLYRYDESGGHPEGKEGGGSCKPGHRAGKQAGFEYAGQKWRAGGYGLSLIHI